MLIDLYKGKPCLILFESNKKNFYEDIGGHIDNIDTKSFYPLATTAIREAFEESRGLINFTNPLHIGTRKDGRDTFVDIKNNKDKYYRCYIVALDKGAFSQTEYNNYMSNKQNLDHKTVPSFFKETHDVKRFYIQDLIRDGIMEQFEHLETTDVKGEKAFIYKRAIDIIKQAHNNQLFEFILKHPIKMIKINSMISV